MAIFAAGNIKMAIDNFKERNNVNLLGVILNKRNVENEEKIVNDFIEKIDSNLIGVVPRDGNIQKFENNNMTVIEGDKDLDISKKIREIALKIIRSGELNEYC